MEQFDTIIVGAGSAGSYLAHHLNNQGNAVVVIEKSRGAGGRCARRQTNHQESVDIGCISLNPDQITLANANANIASLLNQYQQNQLLKPWRLHYPEGTETHLVATPNMNSLHKDLLTGIEVRTQHRVVNFSRGEHNNWVVECENGVIISGKQIIVTAPPAQANNMTAAWPEQWLGIFEEADRSVEAQWSAIVSIDNGISPKFNGLRNNPIIAHAVLDSSKPDRHHDRQLWVIQATPDWSNKHLQLEPNHVGDLLCDALCAALEVNPDYAQCVNAHRWLFGRSSGYCVTDSSLWDPELQIGVAADWLNGGGLHAALISADTLLQQIND